jgi:hypothetical protein
MLLFSPSSAPDIVITALIRDCRMIGFFPKLSPVVPNSRHVFIYIVSNAYVPSPLALGQVFDLVLLAK